MNVASTLNNPSTPDLVYPYRFNLEGKHLRFFEEKKVFLGHVHRIRDVYKLGHEFTIPCPVWLEPYATMPWNGFLSTGSFSYVLSRLQSRTRVGRYCSIAIGCEVLGIDHPTDRISTHIFTFRPYYRDILTKELGAAPDIPAYQEDRGAVEIGHDVWIGQNVKLMPGVKIGHGAVIGSGALVTKDVQPYEIVVGAPAKQRRLRFPAEEIDRLLKSEWWRFSPDSFAGLAVERPMEFIDRLAERADKGEIQPYEPEKIDLAAALSAL